jgi:ethanolamine utilization microcompartment shell protein EutL
MELRTYVLIDSMQPQFAALTGTYMTGDVPVEGNAELIVELAPASDVYEVLDAALKTTDVRPGLLRVEREFGTFEIHGAFQEDVITAGQEALSKFGLSETDRIKPTVVEVKTVTNVNPYEVQLINNSSKGSLLLKGQTLCVVEVTPSAYVMIAANEAEKAADVTLVNYSPSGRFGRLLLAGTESNIKVAREAVITAIESLQGRSR